MARIIATLKNETGLSAKVRYDSDLNAYVVEFSENGIYQPIWTYYTDDKSDAIQTAKYELGIR